MRIGAVVHGGLLAVALVVAYQGGTKREDAKPKGGEHEVWALAPLSSLVLESDKKTVRIERRSDANGSYLWAVVERRTTIKTPSSKVLSSKASVRKTFTNEPKGNAGDAGPDSSNPESKAAKPKALAQEINTKTKTTTREFPIGEAGTKLMEQFRGLRALRSLGALDADQRKTYNLDDKTMKLIVVDQKSSHTMLVAGEKIYGGTDRYMFDTEKGLGYVLAGELLRPLESAENSLGLRKVHSYKDARVLSVSVATTVGETILLKTGGKKATGNHVVWEREPGPGQGSSEASLGSFMGRVKKLRPTKYEPKLNPKALVLIATLRYRDANKSSLGFLELYRQRPSAGSEPESRHSEESQETQYFIKTERTRVLAKVSRLAADRVDKDLVELFGIPAASVVVPKPASAVTPQGAPAKPSPTSPTSLPKTSASRTTVR